MQSHKDALLAVRQFWAMLLHPSVSFKHQARLVDNIHTTRSWAEKTYRRYPSCIWPGLLAWMGFVQSPMLQT